MKSKQSPRDAFGPRVQVSRSSRRGKARLPRHRSVPRLEFLEVRLAPAANLITVTGPLALLDSPTISPLGIAPGTLTAANLRSAIAGAEKLTGSDQIVFDPSLFASGPQTVNLTVIGDTSAGPSGLQINNNADITITGPTGGNGLTVSNGLTITTTDLMRLFDVTPGASLTLQNLTLSNGTAKGGAGGNSGYVFVASGGGGAGLGGAIFNRGTLTLLDSTLTGNTAQGGAGGKWVKPTGDNVPYGGGRGRRYGRRGRRGWRGAKGW